MTPNELKRLLSRYRIKPDKQLGQNFLLSEEVLDQIIAAAELAKHDRVLEIGPGLGFLTMRLAERAGEVVAVEKDRKLVRVLNKIFRERENVTIVQGDALKIHLTSLLSSLQELERGTNLVSKFPSPGFGEGTRERSIGFKLVANIPYYITGKLLQQFLGSPQGSLPIYRPINGHATTRERKKSIKPSLIVFLLQKEVAQRIVASPGDMSILSVSVQLYGEPEIVSIVPKENFYPIPEVDSAILKIKVSQKPRLDVDEKKFFRLVKIGFAGKRKQLQNNLRSFPPGLLRHSVPRNDTLSTSVIASPDSIGAWQSCDFKSLLTSLGINPLARAEDLSMGEWYHLYNRLGL